MLSILPKLPRPLVRVVIGIWRRRWMVMALAWLVAIAGWLATQLIPDMYESRAQVYINTETALNNTLSDVGSRPNLEKEVRIIRTQLLSRDNIEEVIYEVGLDAGIENAVQLERLIEDLSDQITIESEEIQYFVIRHMNTDPVMAQRIVSAVLDLFIEQNLSSTIANMDNALASLDREIAERKIILDQSSERIANFRRQNAAELAGSERLARRLESKTEELTRIDDQVDTVNLRRERLIARLSGTKRYTSGSDLDVLILQLASLKSQFNDDYPDVIRLEAQIDALQSGSSVLPENPNYTEIDLTLRATNDELSGLRRRSNRVQTEIDDLALDMAQTPEAESQLIALLRDQEQIESIYTQLLEKRNKADVTSNLNQAGGTIDFRRFEEPKVAAEPSWPPRGLMTLAILALAFGGGAGLAFILSQLDKTYTQSSDLEESLGLPVLGTLSHAPTSKHFLNVLFDRTALLGALGGLVTIAGVLYWYQEIRIASDEPILEAQIQTSDFRATTGREGGIR